MPSASELATIIVAIIELAVILYLLMKIRLIEENTADTNLLLKHIIDRLDKKDARSTLDELEDELNSNPRQ